MDPYKDNATAVATQSLVVLVDSYDLLFLRIIMAINLKNYRLLAPKQMNHVLYLIPFISCQNLHCQLIDFEVMNAFTSDQT